MRNYFLVADKILRKLAKEYDVPCPDLLQVAPSEKRSGAYYDNQIFIGNDTLHNLFLTVQTIKHEFAHYLEDLHGLEGNSEVRARRFEKTKIIPPLLPKSQKLIVDYMFPTKE